MLASNTQVLTLPNCRANSSSFSYPIATSIARVPKGIGTRTGRASERRRRKSLDALMQFGTKLVHERRICRSPTATIECYRRQRGRSFLGLQLQSSARSPSLVSTGTSSRISINPNFVKVPRSSGLTPINSVRLPLISRNTQRRCIAVS